MANPKWMDRFIAGDTFSDVYKLPEGGVVVGADGELVAVVKLDVARAEALVLELESILSRIANRITELNSRATAMAALKDDLEDLIQRANTP